MVVDEEGLQCARTADTSHPARGAIRSDGVLIILPHAGVHDIQRTSSNSTILSLTLNLLCDQAYLILAVVAGAAVGHFVFNSHIDLDAVSANGKGMACH